jgi:hypothetical protein
MVFLQHLARFWIVGPFEQVQRAHALPISVPPAQQASDSPHISLEKRDPLDISWIDAEAPICELSLVGGLAMASAMVTRILDVLFIVHVALPTKVVISRRRFCHNTHTPNQKSTPSFSIPLLTVYPQNTDEA